MYKLPPRERKKRKKRKKNNDDRVKTAKVLTRKHTSRRPARNTMKCTTVQNAWTVDVRRRIKMIKKIIQKLRYKEYVPVMFCPKFDKDLRQLQRKRWYK